MNFFGLHVCPDEVALFVAGLPILGWWWGRGVASLAYLRRYFINLLVTRK